MQAVQVVLDASKGDVAGEGPSLGTTFGGDEAAGGADEEIDIDTRGIDDALEANADANEIDEAEEEDSDEGQDEAQVTVAA